MEASNMFILKIRKRQPAFPRHIERKGGLENLIHTGRIAKKGIVLNIDQLTYLSEYRDEDVKIHDHPQSEGARHINDHHHRLKEQSTLSPAFVLGSNCSVCSLLCHVFCLRVDYDFVTKRAYTLRFYTSSSLSPIEPGVICGLFASGHEGLLCFCS